MHSGVDSWTLARYTRAPDNVRCLLRLNFMKHLVKQ